MGRMDSMYQEHVDLCMLRATTDSECHHHCSPPSLEHALM